MSLKLFVVFQLSFDLVDQLILHRLHAVVELILYLLDFIRNSVDDLSVFYVVLLLRHVLRLRAVQVHVLGQLYPKTPPRASAHD